MLKQDAREAMRVVFSVLTKRICMHKTNFLRIYSNIVLKVILRYPTKLNNCNRVSPHLRLFSLFNVYKNLYILSK